MKNKEVSILANIKNQQLHSVDMFNNSLNPQNLDILSDDECNCIFCSANVIMVNFEFYLDNLFLLLK